MNFFPHASAILVKIAKSV